MEPPLLIVDVHSADAPSEQFVFDRSPVRVGRGPENDLVIDHAFVSHRHGVLHFDESGVDFVDLGSTNGSFVGDQRVPVRRCVPLYADSKLRLGALTLHTQLDFYHARMRIETRLRAVSEHLAEAFVAYAKREPEDPRALVDQWTASDAGLEELASWLRALR